MQKKLLNTQDQVIIFISTTSIELMNALKS